MDLHAAGVVDGDDRVRQHDGGAVRRGLFDGDQA